MRRIVLAGPHARLRARRWDVVVLGSALPGLVAAVRLAMERLRVLLVEEAAAARLPTVWREPFFVPAARPPGVLDACLRALALPLIDRRRLEPAELAYQVVLPDARLDVGDAARTADELVAWGLAKPEEARALVRELAEAAAAERTALLEAPLVHMGGLRGRARGALGRAGRHARGLPLEASRASGRLGTYLGAQLRALAHVAGPPAAPEVRARLLGAPLEGRATVASAEASLPTLLRRRLAGLHGEVRPLAERFELVHVDESAGVAPRDSDELWLGRALLVNAPRSTLASWLRDAGGEVPDFLTPTGRPRRRVRLCLYAPAPIVPEGMAQRLICAREGDLSGDVDAMTLALFPAREGGFQLVATGLEPAQPPARRELEDRLERAVRELVPFAGDRLRRAESVALPRWDDEDTLEDPAEGAGWPGESELRVATRPRVYRLAREDLGGLGVEGECLLGWRAGEAILGELA